MFQCCQFLLLYWYSFLVTTRIDMLNVPFCHFSYLTSRHNTSFSIKASFPCIHLYLHLEFFWFILSVYSSVETLLTVISFGCCVGNTNSYMRFFIASPITVIFNNFDLSCHDYYYRLHLVWVKMCATMKSCKYRILQKRCNYFHWSSYKQISFNFICALVLLLCMIYWLILCFVLSVLMVSAVLFVF